MKLKRNYINNETLLHKIGISLLKTETLMHEIGTSLLKTETLMHEIGTWLHKNETFPHAIRRLNIFDIFCLSLYTDKLFFYLE